MPAAVNPAVDAFIRTLGEAKIWGEIMIRSTGSGFSLCHLDDRDLPQAELRRITHAEARKLTMFTPNGQFRPLHASPDLGRGWSLECRNAAELWRALQEIYPGSIPDWFAAQSGTPPITDYRDYTNRQSGMYRITQLLSDARAADVARAACHPRFCLKRRLWTVNGAEPDAPAAKSEIPCLEPCAVLLELARKASRIEQEERLPVQLSRSELESFLAAAEFTIAHVPSSERVGNISSAANPRRLQLLLEKFKQEASAPIKSESDE